MRQDCCPTCGKPIDLARGLTVADLARRWRVSEDKVRAWIKNGTLAALNTSGSRSGRPRYVVMPEAIADFERGHAATTPAAPKAKRIKRPWKVDYLADVPDIPD